MRRALTVLAAVVAALPAAGGVNPAIAGKRSTADGPTVRVATYNVCKVSCRTGKWSWPNRRLKVAAIVGTLGADVVAVQETPTLPFRGTTQWADLAHLLRSRGLRITSMKDGCSEGCTRDSHLYYNPETVEVLQDVRAPTDEPAPPQPCMKYWERRNDLHPRRHDPWYGDWYDLGCQRFMDWEPTKDRSTGMVSQRAVSGLAWGGIQDRNLSWAFLQQRSSGQAFLAVSLHLPNEKNVAGERIRRAVASELPGWVDRLTTSVGYPDIPVVIGGDLNSYRERQPSGAQAILTRAGFTDGFDAADRVNERYATINKNGVANARYGGWPDRPYKYSRPGTRIDYVFAKRMRPVRYEVFLRLRGGAFDERFRASDHNPVVVDWVL